MLLPLELEDGETGEGGPLVKSRAPEVDLRVGSDNYSQFFSSKQCNFIYHFALGTSSTSSLGRLQGLSGVLSSRENSNSESSPGPSGRSVSLATPTAAAATPSSNDERVRELMSRLPPAPPIQMGVTTETVTKRSFTETSVKRVTKNEVKAKVEEVVLVKAGGPLGLSIIVGSDHSCVPFGTGEPGIFISKVHNY